MIESSNQAGDSIGERVAIGVEIAESATRLTAALANAARADNSPALSCTRSQRRWYARLPTPPSPAAALEALHTLIERTLQESGYVVDASPNALSIGVAFQGEADSERGRILGMRSAEGWEGYPLAKRLAERWGGHVCIETATAAAALAEAHLGVGQGQISLLYVSLGRNVTSAYVLDGRIARGTHGRAGRLGHWFVAPDGPRCACGIKGHLDPLASAQSLVRNAIGRASASDESTAAMLRISGGRAEAMTAAQVVQLAAEGDLAATEVVSAAREALALTFANLIAMLDPGLIVVGGALAAAGDAYFAPLNQQTHALCAAYAPGEAIAQIVPGALEPFAALDGALWLAMNRN
ncbi:MAG: ROK family protein [Ktedonobacterales bacterium]